MLKLKEMSKLKVSVSLLLTIVMVVASMLVMGYSPPEREEPRMGAWLDEIVGTVVELDLAVPKIQAGVLDVGAVAITDPDLFATVIADPRLGYNKLFGSHTTLTFNVAGTPEAPVFRDGRLNPFAVPRIREAMNWLIDRNYIAEEIFGGMALPRWFPIHPTFPDYSRYIAVARRLELYYAHDPVRAEQVITYEMLKLGAERIDGIWHWEVDGVLRPVEILILGRIEDPRRELAYYVGRLLEGIGFKTVVTNRTAVESAPIWLRTDPYDGLMHIHTPGWVSAVIVRDQAAVFNFFYTPRGRVDLLSRALTPVPEFDELARRLAIRDFETLEERAEMFERALELMMEDSSHIWTINYIAFSPRRADVALAADLAGGILGSHLWALTSRFQDPVTGEIEIGGTMRFGLTGLLVLPWNPIAGTGWAFDLMFIRATNDRGTMPDPFTGLHHPQRIERAEVQVREGIAVGVTLNWVDLQFAPDPIVVPDDAWVDWDATAQRFITLAEAAAKEGWDPARATADVRVRIHYPADMFDTVKWHDGNPLDLADFVMAMILDTFDRANPDSPIHDPAALPGHRTWMGHFRGVRIISENPLIIESFTNHYFLDAEVIAQAWTWFPTAPWHTLVPAQLAEANRELAFGTARATALGVEWTCFTRGPSLPILARHLADAKAEGFIPWAPTLGQFITPEEAAARYTALTNWVERRGHFWIGTGPFYLVATHPIERIVHLRRNPYFVDPAERWVGFATPRLAEVEVIGPTVVRAGTEAVFDIEITFAGEPYPVADVDFVTYFLLDAVGDIVYVGRAVAVRDGLWRVVIPAEKTAGLIAGSTRLEVVVAPIVVAIPSFAATTFVLLP